MPKELPTIYLKAGQTVVVSGPAPLTHNYDKAKTRIRATAPGTYVEPGDPDPPGPPDPPTARTGLIIDRAVLMALPTSGPAWNAVVAAAGQPISPSLSDQDSPANVRCLAAALVAARTGDNAKRAAVVNALRTLRTASLDRALALARELPAYVIAADLIGVTDAELGYDFKAWLRQIVVAPTSGGPSSLTASAKERPNNWGTHAHAALAAAWAYVGDQAKLDEAHAIVLGWLGDRSKYSGFKYGDLAWQADPSKPVGINAVGTKIQGHDVDGALPEEMRRSGGFSWPPPKQNYCWEALQGSFLAVLILQRTGRETVSASSNALERAYEWLVGAASFPPSGDDTFLIPMCNAMYGVTDAVNSPVGQGKNFGFSDWLWP
ncbi:MAG TPA: alginate lyase family protein [Actinomycetota bacterium]